MNTQKNYAMDQLHLEDLQNIRERLLKHPMYKAINTPEQICTFMEYHVFAVWDFMSLLKRLQQDVTCVDVPWVPSENAKYARLVNESVLAEESDEDGHGSYLSHYELYIEAMEERGANTNTIKEFLNKIKAGQEPLSALKAIGVDPGIKKFVSNTWNLVQQGKSHEVAAAFFFGREDLIPDMFQRLVDQLQAQGENVERLLYYLNRHIELDSDEHAPLAQQLLEHLCAGQATRINEAQNAAKQALESRIKLWDAVWHQIKTNEEDGSNQEYAELAYTTFS